jgi:signal transduction histidine kinase
MQEPAGADQRAQIALTVHDDGKSGADPTVKPGMGLLGMRERIAALGGSLSFESSRQGGLVLRAQIPVPPGARCRPAAGTAT